MATITSFIKAVDPRHPGVNNSELQERPVIVEVFDAMADNDDVKVALGGAGYTKQPPRSVTVYRHTGGDLTSAASATFNLSDGATIEFEFNDGDRDDLEPGKNRDGYRKLIHTFSGLTAGSATPAQIAASINNDSALTDRLTRDDAGEVTRLVRAVAGLTTNAVTLFPVKPRSKLRVVGGTANALLQWNGTADQTQRTYVIQTPVIAGGTGWSWNYSAATGELTVVNETGGAVNRVFIMINP